MLHSFRMQRLFLLVFLILISLLLGCASVSSSHSFIFLMLDNRNVKLMDWKYSTLKAPSNYVKLAESGGDGLAGSRTIGLKQVGEFLYVKWQLPPDKKNYEERVDLRPLLPWNMTGAEIRPSFNEKNDLVVYLAIPDPNAPNGTRFQGNTFLKSTIKQIYPVVMGDDASEARLKK